MRRGDEGPTLRGGSHLPGIDPAGGNGVIRDLGGYQTSGKSKKLSLVRFYLLPAGQHQTREGWLGE